MRAFGEDRAESSAGNYEPIRSELLKLVALLRCAPAASVETEANERKARRLVAEWQQIIEENEAHGFSGTDLQRKQLFQMQRALSAVLTQLRRRSTTATAPTQQLPLPASPRQGAASDRRYLFESLSQREQFASKKEVGFPELPSSSAGESQRAEPRPTALTVTASQITQRIHHTTMLANQELERSKAISESVTESSSKIRRMDQEYDQYAGSVSTGRRRLEQLRGAERRRRWFVVLAFLFLIACVIYVIVRRLGAVRAIELATNIVRMILRVALYLSSMLMKIGRKSWQKIMKLSKHQADPAETDSSSVMSEDLPFQTNRGAPEAPVSGSVDAQISRQNDQRPRDSRIEANERRKPAGADILNERVANLLSSPSVVVSREVLSRQHRHGKVKPAFDTSRSRIADSEETERRMKNMHQEATFTDGSKTSYAPQVAAEGDRGPEPAADVSGSERERQASPANRTGEEVYPPSLASSIDAALERSTEERQEARNVTGGELASAGEIFVDDIHRAAPDSANSGKEGVSEIGGLIITNQSEHAMTMIAAAPTTEHQVEPTLVSDLHESFPTAEKWMEFSEFNSSGDRRKDSVAQKEDNLDSDRKSVSPVIEVASLREGPSTSAKNETTSPPEGLSNASERTHAASSPSEAHRRITVDVDDQASMLNSGNDSVFNTAPSNDTELLPDPVTVDEAGSSTTSTAHYANGAAREIHEEL